MGKNYVENSLKRFLKKRVRITLGLVVTFLITGAVVFAEGTAKNTSEDLEYLLLKNISENHFCNGVCPEGVKFNPEGETLELIKDSTGDKRLKIDSEEIYHNHGTIIGGDDTWNKIQFYGDNPQFYNYGNIIFNNGKAMTIYDNTSKAKIYNYGRIQSKSNFILNTKGTDSEVEFYNYGDLKLKADDEQPLGFFAGNEKTIIYNYGSMIALSKNYSGSSTQKNLSFTENGYTLFNNSYINTEEIMIQLPKEEKLFNNGVILTKKFENIGIGGNILHLPTENTIKNKGIFIIESNLSKNEWKAFNDNQGAVLQKQDNGTYKLLNADTLTSGTTINDAILAHGVVKDMSDETEINSTNTADNMFVNDKSLTLNLGNKITGKTITAVSQNAGNTILNNDTDGDKISGNLHLTLDNTTIVGYFEKDGTLLKVDGDLTLENGSIINAVATRDEQGNILADAVAVDVNGKLTYGAGENYIYGKINGGKKSQVEVIGEKTVDNRLNANEFDETIETAGEVSLVNGDWTKGQGSITLKGDNAVVNVDGGNGNLAGYIHNAGIGDTKTAENKVETTLDGMIEGTGKVNINKIRFELGNLDINDLNDTFVIEGNKNIEIENALNKIEVSGIFNKKTDENGNLILSLKSAEEMGIYDPEKQKEYEELVKNFKDTEEFYNLVNKGDTEAIREHLEVLDAVMELLGTAGVKITRDISGAFTDAVIEFDKKAGKGEWLTNAKYIGSDMEYDGTKNINGYDSDINSMVAMAEYGITENTSLGFALGGGDTEIDLKTLNGKSTSFDGENYYAGAYVKHSMNGFDMTGSIGYTISNLDVKNGGSADSEAVTLAGYIKRDVKLTDSVKLEPNLSFTYDYIMQDKAEMGEGMTIDDGSSHIFEAGAGMNIVKEFALEKGTLELRTGAKYYLTNIERNEDVTGKFYNADVNLGSPEIDDNRGEVNIGFDYEHETGFGVNGKYEMMWSDSGDDSRITAGVSYRF